MIYTIEDLAKGNVSLHYNVDDITGLHKVINSAFPNSTMLPMGGSNYYRKGSIDWKSSMKCTAPTQDLGLFLEQLSPKKEPLLYSIEDLKNTKDNRFSFKLLPEDAQRIVKIACTTWKENLFKKWGRDIVLGTSILVSEEDYKKMRKECISVQHELFDDIFGKDTEKLEWIPGKIYELTLLANGMIIYRKATQDYLTFYRDGVRSGNTFSASTADYTFKIIN